MNPPLPPENPPMVRCFAAISLPSELVQRLRLIQQSLRPRVPEEVIRWVGPEQMHLTLKFYGDTLSGQIPALAQAIAQACLGLPCFHLKAQGIGCFPNLRQPRIVWAGIDGDRESLLALQSRIDRCTQDWGSHEETREFSPHLTLGRVKMRHPGEVRGLGEWIRNFPQEIIGTWAVDHVQLIQSRLTSQGSQYSILSETRFTSAG